MTSQLVLTVFATNCESRYEYRPSNLQTKFSHVLYVFISLCARKVLFLYRSVKGNGFPSTILDIGVGFFCLNEEKKFFSKIYHRSYSLHKKRL